MPVVLNQRAWQADPRYLDREWVIYHYPSQYRTRVVPYDRFIYYRPAAGASEAERSRYFGHGVFGVPHDDPYRADHSYVPITWSEPFRAAVPLQDASQVFYETERAVGPQFQSSVRRISETAFFRILALGGISARADFTSLETTERVLSFDFLPNAQAPKDAFRIADSIPQGTGYVPSGALPDVYESAALQERARKDHQRTLELVRRQVVSRGGSCFYNNNVDLFAHVGERRFLIEAKSLTDPQSAVDRMRYGMGQLFDYAVRYRAELNGAEPVLAFGAPPAPTLSWIANVLEENRVGFVAISGDTIVPLNPRARNIPFAAPQS